MAPEQLAPWAKNPKKKNAKWKRAVEKVARSIQEFGFGAPIVARETKLSDGRHEIIKGHVRFEAATLLGLTKIPVRLMPLSAKKSHLLAAADNELAKISEADDEAMEQLLADYDEEERAIAGFEPSDDVDESKASEIEEVDVSAITAEFWMTVRGPLPKQPEAIEALKAAMAKLPGVTVEHGIFGS